MCMCVYNIAHAVHDVADRFSTVKVITVALLHMKSLNSSPAAVCVNTLPHVYLSSLTHDCLFVCLSPGSSTLPLLCILCREGSAG